MSNITTDFIDWGSVGTLWDTGWSWEEGKGVPDAWENKFKHETIRLLKDEVLPTVNGRLESEARATDPGTPEEGQLTWRTDTDRLRVYDGVAQKTVAWKSELDTHTSTTTNPHSVSLDQARQVNNTLDGDVAITNGTLTIDTAPVATQGYVDTAPANVDIQEKGVAVGTVSKLNFKDHLNVTLTGGVLDIDADHDHDSRYYTESEVDGLVKDSPSKESYVEARTSDPTAPQTGRVWLRTD